MLSILAEHIG